MLRALLTILPSVAVSSSDAVVQHVTVAKEGECVFELLTYFNCRGQ